MLYLTPWFTHITGYISATGSLIRYAKSVPKVHSVALLHRLKGFSHTLSVLVHPYRMYAGNRWLSFRFPLQMGIFHGH